jgi:type IV secretory pathway VirB4 component
MLSGLLLTFVKGTGCCFPGEQDKKQLEKPKRSAGMFRNLYISQIVWELLIIKINYFDQGHIWFLENIPNM